jgi:hypothetical protein
VSWSRELVAPALCQAIQDTADGLEVDYTFGIFDRQPSTLNPPAVVVGRPTDVTFAVFSFGTDLATLPVLCVAGPEQEDRVSDLISLVRAAVGDQPNLAGACQEVTATAERNWRNQTVGGVDLIVADCVLTVTM